MPDLTSKAFWGMVIAGLITLYVYDVARQKGWLPTIT